MAELKEQPEGLYLQDTGDVAGLSDKVPVQVQDQVVQSTWTREGLGFSDHQTVFDPPKRSQDP